MNKELVNIQDLKSAFVSHCRALGCEDNYIKVCENKFDIIETALKDYEELLKIDCKQNTINDFYPDTKKMIDDLLDLVDTKVYDFLKEGRKYTRTSVLETLGFAIRYVKTFAYGLEFNETEKIGVNAKKLKAFEIIKEKRVNVDWLIEVDFDLERYNRHIAPFHRYDLNAMEIEILKEVLK